MALDGRDVADFGVEQRRVGDQGEDAGRACDVGGKARSADAGAEQRNRIVCAADQHRRAFLQVRSRRRFARDRAKDFHRLADRRQLGAIDPEQADHRV